MTSDERYMSHALNLSRQGLGRVGNARPSVGCVIVKDCAVIAAARTGDGGAPHGEAAALDQAGENAGGATVYVTLEPCAHEGNTPSCARALVHSRVRRVVVACLDPDRRTNGQGVEVLENAGIEVVVGVLEDQALAMNRGFFLTITENRPLVTLKMAMTIDGKIALENGQSKWITGDLARRYAHLERSRHDAILVGAGTVKADKPMLTTRLPGLDHKSFRVVLGERVLVGESEESLDVDPKNIKDVLVALKNQGITRLLVEGGAQVHASFLRSGFVDRLLAFRAPNIIGADGLSGVGGLNIGQMDDLKRLKLQKTRRLGEDLLEIYEANV